MLGQKPRRLTVGPILRQFIGSQQPSGETFAETLQTGVHTADLDDIGADAVDHGKLRAARINCFISRTASTRPVSTARATIAWPMFSSRTGSSAATYLTFW